MGIKQALTNEISVLASDEGYELVELQYVNEAGRWYLRVFVDKPGGITLDDCSKLSEKISLLLDKKSIVSQRYNLEVSSPGLTRALKTEKDFQRSIGKLVQVNLYQANKDGLKQFLADIVGIDGDKIKFKLESGEIVEIMLPEIALVRLEIKI